MTTQLDRLKDRMFTAKCKVEDCEWSISRLDIIKNTIIETDVFEYADSRRVLNLISREERAQRKKLAQAKERVNEAQLAYEKEWELRLNLTNNS